MDGHRIERDVAVHEFLDLLSQYPEDSVFMTNHTVFRLGEKQRKIFQDTIMKNLFGSQMPLRVGIQQNGNYTAFYKYGKDILRIIIDFKPTRINIVTFYVE